MFVFINVFRQADHIKSARSRTWFTVKTAGKATFFTSFTTAAAFAANIASMVSYCSSAKSQKSLYVSEWQLGDNCIPKFSFGEVIIG